MIIPLFLKTDGKGLKYSQFCPISIPMSSLSYECCQQGRMLVGWLYSQALVGHFSVMK